MTLRRNASLTIEALSWAFVVMIFAFTIMAFAMKASHAGDSYLDLPCDGKEPVAVITSKATPGPTPARAPTPPIATETPPKTPPPQIYGKDIVSSSASVIYVIDISASMGWEPGQYVAPDGSVQTGARIDRAKAALIKSVTSLPKSFKFNIIAYDCSVIEWQLELVDADAAHKDLADAWIGTLVPQGATGTGPAMTIALMDKTNKLVILLTDGAPNCGAGDEQGDASCLAAHLSQIDWANTQHAEIDVFGIGATGDFKNFCLMVAAHNAGSYTDVK